MAFAVVVYLAAGKVVVAALFEHRVFQANDTTLVWLILCGYSLGLLATGSSRLLQNVLFSRGDTVGPARIAALRVFIAATLGFVLMFQFEQFAALVNGTIEKVGDLPAPLESIPDDAVQENTVRLGAVGLALASGLASWVELWLLRRRVRHTTSLRAPIAAPMLRLVPAAAVSAVTMLLLQIPVPLEQSTIAELLTAVVAGPVASVP
jgi:putative peptidoglycan lipid II flippase